VAICGGVRFNGLEQCCGARGAPVAKKPIANLDDCPDRISTPGYVPVANGCGTEDTQLPDHFGDANFVARCNTHDICYVTCPNAKTDCDAALLKGIDRTCKETFGLPSQFVERLSCQQRAENAARVALATPQAARAYEDAQKKGCQCCL
jgi:hypothetical protein